MSVESETPPRDDAPPPAAGEGTFRRARSQTDESRKKEQVRYPITAWAGKLLLGTSSHIPLRLLHAVAGGAARLGSHLSVPETRITRANIELCFPELSPREREKLARASLRQTACMAVELGHLWMRPVEEALGLIVDLRGEEHIQRALARGRGVIFTAPHLGAWELAGLWGGSRFKITTLYRQPRVREMDQVYTNARKRSGATLVPADGSGVRAVFQALARGEAVALLPDQDPGRGAGVFVPFFNVLANTSTLLPRIASRSQASVLIGFAERLPRAAGYRMHILPGSERVSGADLEAGAAALNQDIEKAVRMFPDQYLWSYKRFKFRPPGTPELYGAKRKKKSPL